MSYRQKLNIRKINLKIYGWREMGNRHRCGNHWVNDNYPGQKFSIHEAEYINNKIQIGGKENEAESESNRSRPLHESCTPTRVPA
jgi:hypothetical protein